jgi:type III pantothenate kinase
MNLTVDIGNTYVKTCVFSGNNPLRQDTFSKDILFNIEELISSFPDIDKIIVSSVRKDDHAIISYLQQFKNIKKFILLDDKTPVPIDNLYHSPSTLGNDRLALAVGANAMFPGENVLVIDCGTAITYDVVNNQNEYLGGNISPGIEIRFKALHQFTHRLPMVDKEGLLSLVGKTTTEAIRNGVINGIVYEIQASIASFKEQFHGLNVILTGGDANFFDKKLKNTIFVVLNLIPKGLNRILEYND